MEELEEWEIKARELFPSLTVWQAGRYLSPYTMFFSLHTWTIEAHNSDNIEELQKIYDFARWCVDQDDYNVYNAAMVSFYEHLIDEPITYAAIPAWIEPDIFHGLSQIWEVRLGERGYETLKAQYKVRHREYADKYE